MDELLPFEIQYKKITVIINHAMDRFLWKGYAVILHLNSLIVLCYDAHLISVSPRMLLKTNE